ncbi:hypothetical protein [Streptomyces sp. NBC_00569]|uniref:hypothetical protein n=1 Tax=Streptomyces sp. NBC_00569 TaxID=2975780 RepID=UPI002E80D2A0|nr:hypothetical protein [Streptomyces sp. NBC_00569]
MRHSLSPFRRGAVAVTGGVLTPALAGLNSPEGAASYGTPTIVLSADYVSGAVGATGDPVVTVTVGQSGADASALTVAASASTKSSVAGTGNVTVTGPGATRQVSVAAQGRGYTDLTLKVTGVDGRTATKTLHYAASTAVQQGPGTRSFTGSSDASAAVDAGVVLAPPEGDES